MKESEIRSRAAYDRYLELLAEDVLERFDPKTFMTVPCPVCRATEHQREFGKDGFTFVSCELCGTLFVNPRPCFDELNAFYSDARSTTYWVNEFFLPVVEARREKIFAPRARYVEEILGDLSGGSVADVGAGFGLFLEELGKLWPDADLVAIEPSREQVSICEGKDLRVIPVALEELPPDSGPFDLVTAFELFEHLFDPRDFLERVARILQPGGYFLMTTLNGHGFDLQVLWERSRGFMPPAHLNFANPDAMHIILADVGLEVVEIATPGVLDWDIVEGAALKDGSDVGRFFHMFAENGSPEAKEGFQSWITENGLSSHMRVLARKPV